MDDSEISRAELRGQLKAALAAVESARRLARETRSPVAAAITRIGFEITDAIVKTYARRGDALRSSSRAIPVGGSRVDYSASQSVLGANYRGDAT